MPDPRYLFEPVLFQAVTPVHVGSGQDVGIVDLPVVCERTTGHPYLPGSGIRGSLRNRCEESDPKLTVRIFGNEDTGEVSAGCLSVLDAHLLLFPVRSAPGLFHWITCPFVLRRQRTLYRELCGTQAPLPSCDEPPAEGSYLGTGQGVLYLEEYPFEKDPGAWSWSLELDGVDAGRVVLVADADFLHFVRTATLVRQRNRLSTAKTVLQGQLFSVESLPAETWFVGFFGSTRERVGEKADGEKAALSKEAVAASLRKLTTGDKTGCETHLTLGGDESVGLGITRLKWMKTSADSAVEEGS